MKQHSLNQTGYTLIELLLYVVIVSSLLGTITYFLGSTTDARVKNQSIAEVEDQGTAVVDYITRAVRNASSISLPATGGSGQTLTLNMPAGGTTTFSLNGTTLQVNDGSGNVALTSNDVQVSVLSFKNLTRAGTPGNVQVSFTLTRTNPSNRNEYTYQKIFTGSAEVAW